MAALCLLVGGLFPDAAVSTYRLEDGSATPFFSTSAFGLSPSYLALSADGRTAYAANHDIPDAASGLTAVALTWSSGGCLTAAAPLQPLVPAPDPCHVAIHPSGQWVFSTSYSNGSVSVFPVLPGGLLGAPSTTLLGKNAHQAVFWGASEVLVPLLGSDAVAILAFDTASGALALKQQLALPPGTGPRHLALHPTNASLAYLVLELSSSVAQLQRRQGSGQWEVAGSAPVSTLRSGLPPATVQAAAAIVLAPDARFLYVTNRAMPFGAGDNSIAVLALALDGSIVGSAPCSWATGGQGMAGALYFPRDFALSPAGDVAVAANQRSGTVSVFTRDPASGALGFVATLPASPVASPSFVALRAMVGGGGLETLLNV